MNTLERIVRPLDRAFEWLCLVSLIGITAVVLMQIFGREVLGTSPSWSEEIARLLLVWIGFLGAAIGFREGTHIAITVVTDRFPTVGRHVVERGVQAVVVLFGLFLLVPGTLLVVATSGATLAGSGLPRSAIYLVIPLSGLMICLYTILQAGGVETRRWASESEYLDTAETAETGTTARKD